MSEKEVLNRLLESGKITQEDINEVTFEALKNAAVIIHSICCFENHGVDEGCHWYVEEARGANVWAEGTSHHKWLKQAKDLARTYGLSPKELETRLKQIYAIIGKADLIHLQIINSIIEPLLGWAHEMQATPADQLDEPAAAPQISDGSEASFEIPPIGSGNSEML